MAKVIDKHSGAVLAEGFDSIEDYVAFISSFDNEVTKEEVDDIVASIDPAPFLVEQKAAVSSQIRHEIESQRTNILSALPGEIIELKAKADIARRILSGTASVADQRALNGEAEDRNETLEQLACVIATKARWFEIAAMGFSRIQQAYIAQINDAEDGEQLTKVSADFSQEFADFTAEIGKQISVAYAARKLILSDPEFTNTQWWNADGKPSLTPLTLGAGFEVSAGLRDAVWQIESQCH